jgi:hypothetical protein
MIFVAICAYRDSELFPTIRDCIAKAKYPNDLRFGICLQDEDFDLHEFKDDSRFKWGLVKWQDAYGLGWARSEVQNFYNGEEYALQLDAHHRFIQNWDELLISMMEATNDPRAVLGTYATAYNPSTPDQKLDETPTIMVADGFTPSGTCKFRPHYLKNWQDHDKPVPARFCSGHFTFVPGKWHEEYKFDPDIFFGGEEISMAIRSFTKGWNLYHPHRAALYHEYQRGYRTKIWSDHVPANGIAPWGLRERISKQRIRALLGETLLQKKHKDPIINLGEFGLGTVRTLRDYELYVGINFSQLTITKEAMDGTPPPTGKDGTEIDPDKDSTYFALEDASGEVLHRWYEPASKNPTKFVMWERSKSKGWGKRTDIKL